MNSFSLFEEGSEPTWPAFVRPSEGELLTSWLLRNAHNHNTKVHTFCKIVWPNQQIWNRDIDRLAPDSIINTLVVKTNTTRQRIVETTINSYDGRLFLSKNLSGNSKWILPLAIFHRIHRFNGLLCCPNCLYNDGDNPYYRIYWRLSLSFICPECECNLIECCPVCNAPINFYRNELGYKSNIPNYKLSQCYNCHSDLTLVKPVNANTVSIELQKKLYNILNNGFYNTGQQIIYSHQYFDVLHKLVSIILSKSDKLENFQKELSIIFSYDYEKPKGNFKYCFERMNISTREKALIQADWLLNEWPKRFIDFIKPFKIYSYWLLKDFPDVPFWYYRIIYENFYITNVNRRFTN